MDQTDAFGRLLAALEAEGIRFIVIGMSAAIAQGVMGSTLDIDLWIDLPARQYMRVQTLAHKTGATIGANTYKKCRRQLKRKPSPSRLNAGNGDTR